MKNKIVLIPLVGAMCLVAGTVQAALFGDDQAREAILELRQQTERQQAVNIELNERIAVLQSQNREMLGKVERLEHLQNKAQIDVKTLYDDVEKRLVMLEPSTEVHQGKTFMATLSEKRLFSETLEDFTAKNYRECIKKADLLLLLYSKTGYREATLFWKASAHYALKQNKSAILFQTKLLEEFPDGYYAPEAMLSIATARISLGQKTGAKNMLKKLIQTFPSSQAATVAKKRLNFLAKAK